MRGDEVYVGIDVSTTAVKAVAWSAGGEAAAEVRQALDTYRPEPHRFEQDAGQWWTATCGVLRRLAARLHDRPVAALAIAHQRETFVPLDRHGDPLGPALTWLDARGESEMAAVRAQVDDDDLRRITGKNPNYGPALYKIAWINRHRPDLRGRIRIADVQAFLAERLCGEFATSHSSADPLALFDINRRAWSAPLCAAVDLDTDDLPRVVAPGTPVGTLTPAAADATGLPASTLVVAGGGDGQCAGLGVNALDNGRAYLNLGTAVVAGLFSATPRVSTDWRTLTACAADGYYLESSLRSGALLSDWFLRRICGLDPLTDHGEFERLENEARRIAPGANGLLLLPYWEGVMNPYWDEGARGVILGLADHHDRASVYRALIEGIAMEQALFLEAAATAGAEVPDVMVAIGGLARSALWCQTVADVLGVPLSRSPSVEAASLGAATCAAAGAGAFASTRDAAAAMAGADGDLFRPHGEHHDRHRRRLDVYRELYRTVRPIMARLEALGG
jgi:xylulokinase